MKEFYVLLFLFLFISTKDREPFIRTSQIYSNELFAGTHIIKKVLYGPQYFRKFLLKKISNMQEQIRFEKT